MLEHCTRVSYVERIEASIPSSFKPLLPKKAEPNFMFDTDRMEMDESARRDQPTEELRQLSQHIVDELVMKIRAKIGAAQLREALDEATKADGEALTVREKVIILSQV